MNVLILEDDQILAQVFRDALEENGHSVCVSHSNEQAIGQLRDRLFDILIFDLLIDGETSIPVLDYANYACPDAEAILVTGSNLFPNGELHYSVADVSHRIQKPVKMADLILVIEHFERTKSTASRSASRQLSA